jgi:hypothetical protein
MRNLVIQHIQILLAELEPNWTYQLLSWDQYSNLQLLQLYGDLRVDIEVEEWDD